MDYPSWAQEPLTAYHDSVRQYQQSPRYANLEHACLALSRCINYLMTNYLRNILPQRDFRHLNFPALLKVIKEEGHVVFPSKTEAAFRKFKQERNLVEHEYLKIDRREFEVAASATTELFKVLCNIDLAFTPTLPLPFLMEPYLGEEIIGRDEEVSELIKSALSNPGKNQFICGMAGIGKTSIATVVCKNTAIQDKYTDGNIWLVLDENSNLDSFYASLCDLFRISFQRPPSAIERQDALRTFLSFQKILIIIDNADFTQAGLLKNFFSIGGKNCSFLITTRDVDLAANFPSSGKAYISELSLSNSIKLIKSICQSESLDDSEIGNLCESLGRNPLGLMVAGKLISSEFEAGIPKSNIFNDIIHSIVDEPIYLEWAGLSGEEVNIANIIGLSYRKLPKDTQSAFRLLIGYHYSNVGVTSAALQAIWETSVPKTSLLINRLYSSGLLMKIGEDRFNLHSLIKAFLERVSDEDEAGKSFFLGFLYHLRKVTENELITIDDMDLRNSLAAFRFFNQTIGRAPDEFKNDKRIQEFIATIDLMQSKAMQNALRKAGLWSFVEEWEYLSITSGAMLDNWRHVFQGMINLSNSRQMMGNLDTSIEICNSALVLAKENLDVELESIALNQLSTLYIRINEIDKAEEYANLSYQLSNDNNVSSDAKRHLLQNFGEIKRLQGSPIEALGFYDEAYKLLNLSEDQFEERAVILNSKGMALEKAGNYYDAIKVFEESIEYAEKAGNSDFSMKSRVDLGYCYHQVGMYEDAILLLEPAKEYYSQGGNLWLLVIAINNLGLAYRDIGNLNKAQELFNESLKISLKASLFHQQAHCLGNIGSVLRLKGLLDNAINRLHDAEKIYARMKDYTSLAYNLFEQGRCTFENALEKREKGKNATKLFEKAKALYKKSIDYGERSQYLRMQGIAWGELAQVEMYLEELEESEKCLNRSDSILIPLGIPMQTDIVRSQLRRIRNLKIIRGYKP